HREAQGQLHGTVMSPRAAGGAPGDRPTGVGVGTRSLAWSALLLAAALAGFAATAARAQVFSNKVVGEKNKAYADSLKKSSYPYILPIWGEKATKRGFSLPYSAGVSAQYFGQRSDIVIENLKVGFNNGTMHDLDGIVRFDKAKSRSDGVSLRPDVW